SGDTLWKLARQHNVTVAALKKANNLTSDTLKVGQKLMIPVSAPASASTDTGSAMAATSVSSAPATEGTAYTVASGDSLWKIANRNGITVDALRKANNLTSDSLKVGQKLVIPARATAAPAQATATPTTTTTAGGAMPTVSAGIVPWSPSAVYREPGTYQENSQTIHVVDHNESPATIARKYGVRVEDLMRVNGITDPRQIHYGQSLIIPSARSGAVAPVSTVTPGLSSGN
ncbi:MAG: LysM peptidoglycan-binding domain-containing protein, partial [Verrucomicrobiae bacterium]|nr:LysM peptidoglycan-binding domain-containing protein [Verrucomicrobiae bacterium]